MSAGARLRRTLLVFVAAYAMLVHALVMGAAPAVGNEGAASLLSDLRVLCSGDVVATGQQDDDHRERPRPAWSCVFCASCHACLQPASLSLVASLDVAEPAPPAGADVAEAPPPTPAPDDTRPRDPPAFV
ncbi:MAG TPA: hypothetical protein VGC51_15205 [Hansschlegelia sp.]